MTPRVIFRCDSSFEIGAGHQSRCLNLANKLSKLGYIVYFVCRKLSGNQNFIIENQGHTLVELDCPQPSEFRWDDELDQMTTILKELNPNWLVLDHYELNIDWETSLQSFVKEVLVIDDLFRDHAPDSYILDQNFHTDHRSKFKAPERYKDLFLGPEYALTNFEHQYVHKPQPACAKNILAFFGGSDHLNASQKFIDAFQILPSSFKGRLIMGHSNLHAERIITKKIKGLEISRASNSFHEYLISADIFISASGSTVWERCFFGIPGIVVTIASNQEPVAKSLYESKIHNYIGKIEDINPVHISKQILQLASDVRTRELYSINSKGMNVSGKIDELLRLFKCTS
ncbi:MAG: UDP-2,4-diacetamido-2,4,6-trideoxy-beta-L-altropyranose hydrolase [Halobacteriovorax sp.]|nr:UDP-2,4-diacetamido-2,4,6-trideoxy-beta-L-altropyranose hydrolase [Halobacteriovorax sp.]